MLGSNEHSCEQIPAPVLVMGQVGDVLANLMDWGGRLIKTKKILGKSRIW